MLEKIEKQKKHWKLKRLQMPMQAQKQAKFALQVICEFILLKIHSFSSFSWNLKAIIKKSPIFIFVRKLILY